MEKETELYLIKRIKELEEILRKTANKLQLKEIENGSLNNALEQKRISANEVVKAEAFDKLVQMLGIKVCHLVKQKRYALVIRKVGLKLDIDEEIFKQLWCAING